jgi:hypothetical protein
VPDYFVHEEENARYKFEKMWFFLSVIKKKETTYRNHHGRVRCGPPAHWFISLLEISLVFIIDITRLLGFDPKMVGKIHKPRRREISPSHNVIGTTEHWLGLGAHEQTVGTKERAWWLWTYYLGESHYLIGPCQFLGRTCGLWFPLRR